MEMKNQSLFSKYRSVVASFKDVKDRKDLLLKDFGEERMDFFEINVEKISNFR